MMIRSCFLGVVLLIFVSACAPTMKVTHTELWALRDKALEGGDADLAAFFAATPGYRIKIDGADVARAIDKCVGERLTSNPDGTSLHELFICRYPYSDADCVTLWIDEEQGLVARCTFTEELRRSVKSRSGYFRCRSLDEDLSCSRWTYLGRRKPPRVRAVVER